MNRCSFVPGVPIGLYEDDYQQWCLRQQTQAAFIVDSLKVFAQRLTFILFHREDSIYSWLHVITFRIFLGLVVSDEHRAD